MNNKIIAVVVAVVLMGGSFYAGMTYAKSGTTTRGQFAAGNFAGRTGMGMGGRGMGGGFTAGEILSKDASSVTIKMQDGSTKIALIASSTIVMKATTGTLQDLTVGTNVVVTGSTNSDGSVTAQSVQIRPATSQTR